MPLSRRLLNEGEQVLVDLRPHWSFVAAPAAAVGLLIVVSIAVVTMAPSVTIWALGALLAGLALSGAWLVARYVRWVTTTLVVTSHRLVHRRGVMSRHGREIPVGRLEDLSVHQSLAERISGSGRLVVESGGERGAEVFGHVARPTEVARVIHAQIAGQRLAAGQGPPPVLSRPEQLDKLDELRRRGVISATEFRHEKERLLGRR